MCLHIKVGDIGCMMGQSMISCSNKTLGRDETSDAGIVIGVPRVWLIGYIRN